MFGVFTGHHFARRLVIKQHTRHRAGGFTAQWTSVDPDEIHRTNPLSHMRWLAINRYPTGENQLLHVATRTDTRFRQDFMQFGRIVIGQRTNVSWQPTPRITSIETHCGLHGPTRNTLLLGHLEVWSRCSWTPAASAPRRPSRSKFGPRVEPTRLPLLCR